MMSPNVNTQGISINSKNQQYKKNSTSTIVDSWSIAPNDTISIDDDTISTEMTTPSPMSSTGDFSVLGIAEEDEHEEEETLMCTKKDEISLENWGYPGYLSREQCDTLVGIWI